MNAGPGRPVEWGMNRASAPLFSLALAASAMVCPGGGLPGELDAGMPATQPEDADRVMVSDLLGQAKAAEPIRRAGLRADLLRRTQRIVPTVVIVRDTRSYLHAIAGWEGPRRYPVLFDDGSARAREDIARFVRAFGPESVVRVTAPDDAPAWPASREDRAGVFLKTAARALGEQETDYDRSLQSLREQGIVSPGMVLTDVDDPAWVAGLALAVARLQPVGFIDAPGTMWQPLTSDQAAGIEKAAQDLAVSTGLSWREMGDDIDAIALCANINTKMTSGTGQGEIYATSSRVGRFDADGVGARWADTGQIFGSFSQAAYRAMCALFLSPREAFVFDGYNDEKPWDTYDGSQAASQLDAAGFDVQVHDLPQNTAALWETMTARPNRGGLWLINSHGQQSVLNLQKGAVNASDMPLLEKPAMVHIVHSFSTANPANTGTLAGAMLDNGVYAMLGSVDEPFLQAFMPTPMVPRRLLAGMHFASAVRFDDAPVWKLAVIGDPLITLGPPGERTADPATGVGGTVEDLDETLKGQLKSRDLAGAAATLTLLGRDADAARLAAAVIDDDEMELTADLAEASIPALFRERKFEEVLTAYAHLTDDQRQSAVLGDCFWFSARFLLTSSSDAERAERMMRQYQRPDAMLGDAEEVARRIKRRSTGEAVVFLESFRPRLTKQWEFNALDAALNRIRGNTP